MIYGLVTGEMSVEHTAAARHLVDGGHLDGGRDVLCWPPLFIGALEYAEKPQRHHGYPHRTGDRYGLVVFHGRRPLPAVLPEMARHVYFGGDGDDHRFDQSWPGSGAESPEVAPLRR